jgi:hypothetical protein
MSTLYDALVYDERGGRPRGTRSVDADHMHPNVFNRSFACTRCARRAEDLLVILGVVILNPSSIALAPTHTLTGPLRPRQ